MELLQRATHKSDCSSIGSATFALKWKCAAERIARVVAVCAVTIPLIQRGGDDCRNGVEVGLPLRKGFGEKFLVGNSPAGHALLIACLVAVLFVGVVLSFYRERRVRVSGSDRTTEDFEQDALSVSSRARNTVGGNKPGAASGSELNEKAENPRETQGQQAGQRQQQAAAEQATQQAELDEKRRELEQQAAAQQAQEQQLEQERLRVEAENERANAAAAHAEQQRAAASEAERLRQQALENQPRPVTYSGPSSGSIVWQGEVQGTTLVTIDGNTSDTGQIVSGALPGVLVMVQPADAKHVGVAGAPAPSNSFRRLTLRIQGKGVMQEVIHWSIP
jgi:hypothetical protein